MQQLKVGTRDVLQSNRCCSTLDSRQQRHLPAYATSLQDQVLTEDWRSPALTCMWECTTQNVQRETGIGYSRLPCTSVSKADYVKHRLMLWGGMSRGKVSRRSRP